ncbi:MULTISPECIES: CDP-alcohol phosphatidyltransferase family protein [unclassified Adlercreutzia]|uniref:CDP-alcohol phosphatidyltransferase family protein n=1 Tax=unclassified Adlercreutzia TaxID=2636013 RepID=UPI0013EB6D81
MRPRPWPICRPALSPEGSLGLIQASFLPAFVIYAVAGLVDMLDGFATRRAGTESELGARLDSAADAVLRIEGRSRDSVCRPAPREHGEEGIMLPIRDENTVPVG